MMVHSWWKSWLVEFNLKCWKRTHETLVSFQKYLKIFSVMVEVYSMRPRDWRSLIKILSALWTWSSKVEANTQRKFYFTFGVVAQLNLELTLIMEWGLMKIWKLELRPTFSKIFRWLKLYSRHLREFPKILEGPFGEVRSFMSWSWLMMITCWDLELQDHLDDF
jgi:hypothetical protein